MLNIGFGEEITQLESFEVFFTHLIWSSDSQGVTFEMLAHQRYSLLTQLKTLKSEITKIAISVISIKQLKIL